MISASVVNIVITRLVGGLVVAALYFTMYLFQVAVWLSIALPIDSYCKLLLVSARYNVCQ